jgi:hypothetical protein
MAVQIILSNRAQGSKPECAWTYGIVNRNKCTEQRGAMNPSLLYRNLFLRLVCKRRSKKHLDL